ncbi:hypothetical protein Moror_14542 [Moniliophthora roreri MCA 2997]|uniref:Uncharacterized protein n=1 Tax=Moniliophthora roreri (strain MCA 2997) TaxID=1381753 RepID=V2YNL9_MONRO|nr:hypothetical protein Moror_14542 [Moniliophthora roreri MCA 2997]
MAISTSQSIRDNAQYHAELIKSLEELQYAPSALTQQTSYLTDLEKQLRTTKENVERLSQATKKERKDHEKMRDSTARKLAARISGKKEKFEAKKEKEEREYVEALENEMRERGNMKMIEDMIEEGKRVKDDLTAKSLALHQIEQELETLYENIFGGPTQEFPRDDQLENQLMSAQEAYDRIQGHMNAQSQAVNLLGQADKAMASCLQSMQVALGYSSWDVFGGGGMADMMERSALGEASAAASRAQMLVDQAQRTSPDVQSVGPIRVHEISLFGDVFFDNVYSDIVAHQKMEANRNELMNLHDRIKRELRAATARCQRIGPDLVEAAEVLSQSRQDLAQFRKDTFNRVSGFGPAVAGDSSLPSYQESPSSFPNPQQTYYPPPDGPPPASSSSAIIQYSPPAGPPPGHTRSSSSVSAAKDLPSLPQSETGTSSSSQAYQPPPGPPPGHSANVQYSSPAAHPTGGVLPNYAGSTKDLPTLPQSETGSSPSQDHQVPPGLPPSHSSSSFAPAHWGSRNPFAMTLMGQYAHQTEGEENGKK